MADRILLTVVALCFVVSCAPGAGDGGGGSMSVSPDSGGAAMEPAPGPKEGTSTESGALSAAFSQIACDKASVSTLTSTSTSGTTTVTVTIVTTTYYADIPVAGLDPKAPPLVRFVTCPEDLESYSPPPATGSQTTTTHSGDPDPTTGCSGGLVSYYAPGHAYVFCGQRQESGGAMTYLNRYRRAYVAVN